MFQIPSVLRRSRAFTLIELLVVVLIISILALLVLPNFLGQRDGAKDARSKTAVRAAMTTAKSYYSQNDTYAGFDTQSIAATKLVGENTLKAAALNAAATEVVGADGADDKKIYVSVPSPGEVTLCSNSSGSGMYCMHDNQGSGATTYREFPAGGSGAGANTVWDTDGAYAGTQTPDAQTVSDSTFKPGTTTALAYDTYAVNMLARWYAAVTRCVVDSGAGDATKCQDFSSTPRSLADYGLPQSEWGNLSPAGTKNVVRTFGFTTGRSMRTISQTGTTFFIQDANSPLIHTQTCDLANGGLCTANGASYTLPGQ